MSAPDPFAFAREPEPLAVEFPGGFILSPDQAQEVGRIIAEIQSKAAAFADPVAGAGWAIVELNAQMVFEDLRDDALSLECVEQEDRLIAGVATSPAGVAAQVRLLRYLAEDWEWGDDWQGKLCDNILAGLEALR